MAQGKKSFILYADYIESIEELTNEEAGKLLKHILRYVNDLNPVCEDRFVNQTFIPIKTQLKRDLESWEDIREKRRESGKKGGRPKKQTEANKANGFFEKQTKAKKAVNDNVTVNVNDNDILLEKETKIYRSFAHLKLSIDDYNKLESLYHKEDIESTLDAIENYSGNKKYKSLYLTCKNWLKDKKKISEESTNVKSGTNQLQPKYDD